MAERKMEKETVNKYVLNKEKWFKGELNPELTSQVSVNLSKTINFPLIRHD